MGSLVEGQQFGRYRLRVLLGGNFTGSVWRAEDTVTGQDVAVKLVSTRFADDRAFRQRMGAVIQATQQLSNPYIPTICDYGEIDGRIYVTWHLINGRNLQDALDEGPFGPERAVRVVSDVAAALQNAHSTGLVHGDVKSSNILLGDHETGYLLDLGMTRSAEEAGLTTLGANTASWGYSAPERFQYSPPDERTDIYALACVLYELLTGNRPYPTLSLEQAANAHMMQRIPRPSEARDHIPPGLDLVVAVGMAKAPQSRYATAMQFAAAARDALGATSRHY